jgi:hypothetical protein
MHDIELERLHIALERPHINFAPQLGLYRP